MNKIKYFLLVLLVIIISVSLYILQTKDKVVVIDNIINNNIPTDDPIKTTVNNVTPAYWNKLNSTGLKFESLNDSDKKTLENFKIKLTEEYKSNGNIQPIATDTLSILYIDDKLALFRVAGYSPCNSAILISRVNEEVLRTHLQSIPTLLLSI